jgi:hypothetical protein
MSFNAGSIRGTLGLDISDFTRGMISAQGLMSVFPSWVTNFMSSPLLGLIGIAKDAGGALLGMLKGVTDAEDDLQDMAKAVGVNVSFLDGLGKAAELSGSNLFEMAEALKFLNKSAYDAATLGGTANKSFELMRVSVKGVGGALKDAQTLAEETIEAFSKLPDGPTKGAVAMDLFGRAGTKAISFFSQGIGPIKEYMAQLEAMGALATDASAKQADAWNDLLTTVSHAWSGIKKQLIEPIRDALKPYLEGLVGWVQTHGVEVKSIVNDVVKSVVAGIQILIPVLKLLLNHLQAVLVTVGALAGAKLGQSIGSLVGTVAGNLIAPGVGGVVGAQLGAGIGGLVGGSIGASSNTFNINIDGSRGNEKTLDDLQSQVSAALRDADQRAASESARRALGGL